MRSIPRSRLARERRPDEWGRRRLTISCLLAGLLTVVGIAGGSPTQARTRSASQSSQANTDWPAYLHDMQRTASQTDTTISAANAGQLTKLWSYATGGIVAASATVVNNVIYVGSWDGYEYAINATNGALVWKQSLGITTTTNPNCYPSKLGVTSTAAVSGGVVYVGGGDTYWYALDAGSGAVLWKVYTGDNSTSGGHYNWSSPLLYNGYAYIGVASLSDCPLVQGQLIQVSLSTHQVVNTLNLVPNGQVGGGVWTSPSVDPPTNTIFVTTGTQADPSQTLSQAIVAIDANTLAVTSSWQIPSADTVNDSDWGTSPLLFDDANGNHLVLATNKNGILYAFKRSSLSAGPVWSYQVAIGGNNAPSGQGSVSSAAIGGGLFYQAGGNTTIGSSGTAGSIRAFNPVSGALVWTHADQAPIVPAIAYSNGLVFAGNGNTLEALDATNGNRLYSFATGATIFGPPSVASGRVFIGSNDGSLYAFGLPASSPQPPPPDPNCPAAWTCQDIGGPSPSGGETISGGSWIVSAAGSGLSTTSDQGRLISQTTGGDAQIVAGITTESATSAPAQVGITVRQSADPTSPFYAASITPGGRLTVQYRSAWSGVTATKALVTAPSLPAYIKVQRTGDSLTAAVSSDSTTYTLVPGSTAVVTMPFTTLDGIFSASGANGAAWSASLQAVTVGGVGSAPLPAPTPHPCPSGWACQDVGNPSKVGDQTLNAGTWTVTGAGSDIAGYSDQFHYVWQSFAADATVSARLVSQTSSDSKAKSGLMLRQSPDSGAAYYAALLTPANTLNVQFRPSQGLNTTVVTTASQTAPAFVRITRSGNAFSTYTSTDGATWNFVLGSGVTVSLTGAVLGGMAVTSHNGAAFNTGGDDTVTTSSSAPPAPQVCPSGWACQDIGNPYPAGSQSVNNGTWSVLAGGGDIWGTADQFRLVAQQLSGDATVGVRVVSQTNTSAWAKAGVMLRQSNDPGSAFYAAFMTPTNGIVIQYRTSQGGAAAQAAALSGTTPEYLEVVRWGNTYGAYTSPDGSAWTLVAGSVVNLNTAGAVLAGMAVTSHSTFNLSTAVFTAVSVSATAPPNPTGCPSGWSCGDVGGATPAGTQSLSGVTWTVTGGGSDIWGAGDQFHYAYQPLPSDGSITAQVASQSNSSAWAKAGVMIRQTVDANSAFYAAFVTPSNGVVIQSRSSQGASAAQQVAFAGATPEYLGVARSGTSYTAYTSGDGSTWTVVPGSTVAIGVPGAALAGLAVTSHNGSALSTVTFNGVTVSTGTACPLNWSCTDVGGATPPGGQSISSGSWTISGGGNDIWGTADQFHFVYQSLAGDGSSVARVTSQTNTAGWAKAGVMIRQTTDPGSSYYAAFVTPGNGISVQYRAAQGGGAAQSANIPSATVPVYLEVARHGTSYTAYTSTDGSTWSVVTGSTTTIGVSGPALAGLAVTSHNAGALSTAGFDSVIISTSTPPDPTVCPAAWTCADIGPPTPAGSQSFTNSNWMINGGGADIWGTSDQFRYISQSQPADGGMVARVVSQTNSQGWAKAGLMIRQSSSPSAAYYAIFVTPGNGIVVQARTSAGAAATSLAQIAAGSVPVCFEVWRAGNAYTAYTSQDCATWTLVAGSSATLFTSGGVLVGLAITSHNTAAVSTVNIDSVAIPPAHP